MTLDRRRVRPKDPSLFNMIRHKTSRILKASHHFDVIPVDQDDDPYSAEYWRQRLRLFMSDPSNNVRDVLTDVVCGALAARVWAAEISNHPHCGIVIKSLDPRNLTWCPGYKSPHEKDCPWIDITRKLPLESVRRMEGWKNTQDLKGEGEDYAEDGQLSRDAEIVNFRSSSIASPTAGDTEVGFVTVVRRYYKYDLSTIKKRRGMMQTLHPDQRYMQCPDCGSQSVQQGMLGYPLPEADICDQCGSISQRQDGTDYQDEYLKYPDGRRLVIFAPNQRKMLYDGGWEFDRARSAPAYLYKAYWHPTKPIPLSDTTYYRSLQLIINSMYRMGYEQMMKSKGWILAPEEGLVDFEGRPWQFSDYQDVAYYRDILAPNAVQYFQPQGINAAWVPYLQSVQGSFSANKGTGDIGLAQGQSKDIAVGTIETLVETGEIPVDNHIDDFQVFMSRFLTGITEAIGSTETVERALRITGPGGVQAVMKAANALPGVDIIVTAEPTLKKEQTDMIQAVMALAQVPGPLRRFVAAGAGIPASLIDQLERDEAAQAQAMPPAIQQRMNGVPQGMPNGVPGMVPGQ